MADPGGWMSGAADAENGRLDRDAPLPLYFQVRDALLDEMRERDLSPGDRLPTEADLERRYGVSRATIRQALAELESEGRVKRIQGKGTFVAVPKIQHVPLLASFSELLRKQGYDPSHRILESRTLEAPPTVADDLGVEDGTPCRFLRRLLLADGRVVGVSDTWLSRDAIRGHEHLFESERLATGSLYELLQGPAIGLALRGAIETITAATADETMAGLLACTPGSPVLTVKRVTSERQGRPVESTRLVFSGERYEYRVELFPPGPGASWTSQRAIRSAATSRSTK
ncbi:MAG: GntR family transcriptional regulator [Actinomycetota bacterium]